jgi:hypothetical protein
MVPVPELVWVVAAAATGATILGLLSALANETAHEVGVHALKKQVIDLRVRYLRRMIEHYGLQEPDDTIEVEIVDDTAPPAAEGADETYEPAAAA